jgi:hypothetical protein
MSAIYDSFREQLIEWLLLGGLPASPVIHVLGVDSTYVFDTTHVDAADLGASVVLPAEPLVNFTYVGGVLRADNLLLEGLTPGPIIDALVVLFTWAGGEALVCYIDSATDASLPMEITTGKLNIIWGASGICKI